MKDQKKFIDLFAGCGGFSLGISRANWNGKFAIEKSEGAFKTFEHNFIQNPSENVEFDWPEWLPQDNLDITEILKEFEKELENLAGEIQLVVGGPPCQGFSYAGRRNGEDSRNKLLHSYIDFISMVKPNFLLVENVKGITSAFKGNKQAKAYSKILKEELEKQGYSVFPETCEDGIVRSADFGIAQLRPRFILIGIQEEIADSMGDLNPHKLLQNEIREEFLETKGLDPSGEISVKEAISDLEAGKNRWNTRQWKDSSRFRKIKHKGTRTKYQELMHQTLNGESPNSLRLANHRENTQERFEKILENCEKGKNISKEDREKLGLNTKKQSITPLHPEKPAHTITTLPDDIIHYKEPRILTVRENARLQSFPDWFEFQGKYTTGGKRRRHETPRYTQVGNAVPPFLAESLGLLLNELIDRVSG
jgi:DNA (cytosine-5)-methyltransferase 1